jgi:hypothetical protein
MRDFSAMGERIAQGDANSVWRDMPDFEIRPANTNDLPRLMAMDHSV